MIPNDKKFTLFSLTIIILICHGLLNFLIVEINDSVATLSITLFIPGIFIAFPALNMRLYPAILCNILTGFLIDSITPIPFGLTATIFLIIQLIISRYRQSIKRNNLYHGWVIAQITNMILFFAVTLWFNSTVLFQFGIFFRTMLDFLLSQLVLAVITSWYLQLLKEIILWAGIDLNQDDIVSN